METKQSDKCKLNAAMKRIKQLEVTEVLAKSYRVLPEQYHKGMLETLVRCAYECGEISMGRAAELLDENVQATRERCWNPDRFEDTDWGEEDDE